MSERRYSEEEVRAIFERATAAQQSAARQLPAGGAEREGMTLADLRAIGGEVGIPAALVEQAALSLDVSGAERTRRFLGMPLGVARTVELNRRLTDEEWERLVVDLRETFDARGSVRSEGSLKQWTNGNLQALLEPTATGHRLRLRTVRGASRALMNLGVGLTAGSAVLAVAALFTAGASEAIANTGTFFFLGIGMFAAGAARLPAWARERREQMDGVASRLLLSTSDKPPLPGQ